jgi:acyl-CoA hydrolase
MTKSPIEQAREEAAEYVDALDHIMRVANASRTQTRRLRWIAERARCALEGGDWRELDLPRSGKSYEQKYKELKEYAESLERNPFTLTEDQRKQIDEWMENHDCSIGPYFGAVGGKYIYKFNPTSIGTCIECECACGQKIDVTDSESW